MHFKVPLEGQSRDYQHKLIKTSSEDLQMLKGRLGVTTNGEIDYRDACSVKKQILVYIFLRAKRPPEINFV